MLGKKKVGLEPTVQVEVKAALSVTTISSSKTTSVSNGLKAYMGCQSSMMKLIKTNTTEAQPVPKGKTPIIFGQLKKKQNGLL